MRVNYIYPLSVIGYAISIVLLSLLLGRDTVVTSILFNGRLFPTYLRVCLLLEDLNVGEIDLLDPPNFFSNAFFFATICVASGGLAKISCT